MLFVVKRFTWEQIDRFNIFLFQIFTVVQVGVKENFENGSECQVYEYEGRSSAGEIRGIS